jgi:polysaccharide export outer membrane protein
MPMIRLIALLAVVFSVGDLSSAYQSQGQPPASQPATQSPAIILPPQPAVQAAPDTSKPAKGIPDPSKVPAAKDPTATSAPYVIGPEDILGVKVWHDTDFSGTYTVGPDGMISIQLIGEVKAAGLTTHQLEEVLTKRLTKEMKEPEVNVQVLRPNSRTYIILGDGVIKPGQYPLPRPMTVLEALLAGGGFSPFANKKKIYVLRGTVKFKFNWDEVTKGKHLEQNIPIQNGDQIFVP